MITTQPISQSLTFKNLCTLREMRNQKSKVAHLTICVFLYKSLNPSVKLLNSCHMSDELKKYPLKLNVNGSMDICKNFP